MRSEKDFYVAALGRAKAHLLRSLEGRCPDENSVHVLLDGLRRLEADIEAGTEPWASYSSDHEEDVVQDVACLLSRAPEFDDACPYCGDPIEGRHVEIEQNMAYQECTCVGCDAVFRLEFRLESIVRLEDD
jgi:hypothetical protein